jgi:predicted alpha/beta hydrolase
LLEEMPAAHVQDRNQRIKEAKFGHCAAARALREALTTPVIDG